MTDLDEASWPLDSSNFLGSLRQKADFIRDGHRAGTKAALPLEVDGLLFAGMGFSGVSSNLVKDAATRSMDYPFTIVKHYQFPHHVKPSWHTLAVSYSGATEETLTVARESAKRGTPVTSFATGGPITEIADRNVLQPAGHQPRAALPFAWFSILGFLEGSGLLNDRVPVNAAAAAVQSVDEAVGTHVDEVDNEAKQLARKLVDKIPQIYATPSFYGVGLHFKGMINENAKKIADVDLLPESNHNDLSGWGGDVDHRQLFACMALSHADQNPEIQKRIAFMAQRYTDWGIAWHHHEGPAIHTFEDHVTEQARAIQFLDYTTFYMAMLRGVDPSAIPEIKGLKQFIRGG